MSKRKSFDLSTKLKIIEKHEENPTLSFAELGKPYEMHKSIVCRILNKKEEILKSADLLNGLSTKKTRKSEFPDIEEALITWIKQARSQNIPLDGPMIREKSLHFAAALGYNDGDFKASNGWLSRFKTRHGASFQRIQGEGASVTTADTKEWLETTLPGLLKDYAPRDVYNVDESALFWEALPDKTFVFKLNNDKCQGGKRSKIRITFLVGANMDGTDKLRLMAIGRSKNPRCFPKNRRSLQMDYEANAKAWMTGQLFEAFLKKLDKKFSAEKRSVLFVVDNCPAHPKDVALKSIKVVFLPPNTTSKTQPMDQGVIQNLKLIYRRKLVQKRIDALDTRVTFKHNLWEAMVMLNQAWQSVQKATIANCFKKAGFSRATEEVEILDDSTENAQFFLEAGIEQLRKAGLAEEVCALKYVSFDDATITTSVPTEEEIVAAVLAQNAEAESESESDSDDIITVDELVEDVPVSFAEASQAVALLRRFVERNDGEHLANALDEVNDYIDKTRLCLLKQSNITVFFK